MNSLDHTCPICGKNFIPAPLHIYRSKNKDNLIFCTYTCWNKYLNGKENKKFSKHY